MILISVFWPRKKLVLAGVCILFLVFGVLRHQFQATQIAQDELKNYHGQQVTLLGIVSEEPANKEKTVKLTINCQKIFFGQEETKVFGKILVTTNKYPEYEYGDELEISGLLQSPSEDIDGFNYKEYLSKEGIYSQMSWPKIEKTGSGLGNPVLSAIFSFKNKVESKVDEFLFPPQSGLLKALFFGNEEDISQEWKDKFSLTGTRHITAVSGMNITIICALVLNFFLALGFWRKHAFYFSVIIIILYILMIGAPPSALRAGVMGGIFLAGQHFGRVSESSRALVFAASFMLLMNPLLLRLDVGFQLSFLATLGLICLQPFFARLFSKWPDFLQIKYALTATLSAQIFTLPILIMNFGQISLISPLINVMIVPLFSLITILGFLFIVFASVAWPLGQIFSMPLWLLLTYVIKTVDLGAKIPFGNFKIDEFPAFALVFMWTVLIFVIVRFYQKRAMNFLPS